MNYSAVILSGGQSRRMGSDKGSLVVNGKAFVDVLAEHLAGAEELLLSVGESDLYTNEKLRHIQDEYANCGPMGGIHKALKVMSGEWLFTAACDMPELDDAFARVLLETGLQLNKDARVIIPVDREGRRHMTAAFYHKSLLAGITGLLEAGEMRMRNIAEQFPAVFVPISDAKSIRKLQNLNTPADYLAYLIGGGHLTIPILSVVGYSNSGKTTLIGKIIRRLSSQGLRIAYVKHSHHPIDPMGQGKDNEKMQKAGAQVSLVCNEHEMQWLKNGKISYAQGLAPDIDDLQSQLLDLDLLIVEGFKKLRFDRNTQDGRPRSYAKVLLVSSPDPKDWTIPAEEADLIIGSEVDPAYDFIRDDLEGICEWIDRELLKQEAGIWK